MLTRKTGLFAFFLLLGASCLDDPECISLDNNIIGVTYRVIGTGATENLTFDGVSTDAIDGIFNPGFSGSTFHLALNLFDNQTPFYFQGLDKFMRLGYTVRSQFVSEDCGPRLVMSDLHIIEHNFDSMRIVSSIPGQNTKAKNVEIFRCPDAKDMTLAFFQLLSRGRPAQQLKTRVTGVATDFTPDVYYPGKTVSAVTLPINFQDTLVTYTFDLGAGPQAVTLNYKLTTEARYRPCGVQTFASDLRVNSHQFDSVSISRGTDLRLQNTITDPPQTNVKIFRCPDTNLMQIAFKKPAASGTGNVASEVTLVGITADFLPDITFYGGQKVSSVVLPLNPAESITTYTIAYADSTETLAVTYNRKEHEIFKQCRQIVFSDLAEAIDLTSATVLPADSITFPPVPNIEILTQ